MLRDCLARSTVEMGDDVTTSVPSGCFVRLVSLHERGQRLIELKQRVSAGHQEEPPGDGFILGIALQPEPAAQYVAGVVGCRCHAQRVAPGRLRTVINFRCRRGVLSGGVADGGDVAQRAEDIGAG
jgi:hypothetical protein